MQVVFLRIFNFIAAYHILSIFFLNIFLFGTKEENYVEISNVWRAENKDVKCGKNNYYKKHLLKFKFSVKNKNKLSFANLYFFHLKFSP